MVALMWASNSYIRPKITPQQVLCYCGEIVLYIFASVWLWVFINIFTFSLQQFFLWLWHTRWGTSWPTLVLGKLLFHSLTQSKLWSPFSLLYSLPWFLLRWGVLPQIFFSSFHLEILLADSMALRYNFEKWKMRLDSCNGLLPVLMSYSGLKMSRYLVEMQFTGFAWINIFKTVNNWHAHTHTHTHTHKQVYVHGVKTKW